MFAKVARCLVAGVNLALFSSGPALTKETNIKAVVTGPGLEDEIEVKAPAQLTPLSSLFFQVGFDDQRVEEPYNLGEGFVVTRYGRGTEMNGRFTEAKPWDCIIYYPPTNGQRGLVYYEGYVLGWSGPLGPNQIRLCYEAPPEDDAVMRQILTEHLPPSRMLFWQALVPAGLT